MSTLDSDPKGQRPAHVVPVSEKEFLGAEFLTWLYFHLEANGWGLPAASGYDADEPIRFALGKRVALRRLDQTGARVVLSGSELDGGGELLQAIQRGALIDEMALGVALGNRVYSATLGADGGLAGVNLPDLFTDPEESELDPEEPTEPPPARPQLEDVLELRGYAFADLEDVLDALFVGFLFRRLDANAADADASAMRRAVASGLGLSAAAGMAIGETAEEHFGRVQAEAAALLGGPNKGLDRTVSKLRESLDALGPGVSVSVSVGDSEPQTLKTNERGE